MTAFTSVNTVTTPLTINCNSVTTYNGDPNETTKITFSYQNNLLWATQVNNTASTQTLSADASAGPVILRAGAKVTLQNVGSAFSILFTGSIVDSGSETPFNGTNIGTFSLS
ncbi:MULTISPECIES: hypothetical protein [Pseudomonas fluorescens group]|uniref:Uncharacterized protein n=2 Tax=Pseudomonas fluorescens group TaxID=136843 RepID=A0A1H2MNS3_9PSED|nr:MULTISPECIES: hypothetical protein [Pseudomonas fluorescens group]MBT2298117.1 hypothetical protein [Pseudomonas fluorescens]MBT2309760.1 hypothetical protein [Pseudomonas fluorescens]MBT2314923.1 hypothetical protein [Pseudomonas fluorescens]MBT2327829.1 hypothetical protein [Pseudomonas fluorescens]MBT2345576.1 hypothetical protein [Pseudomonas fluorescens]